MAHFQTLELVRQVIKLEWPYSIGEGMGFIYYSIGEGMGFVYYSVEQCIGSIYLA